MPVCLYNDSLKSTLATDTQPLSQLSCSSNGVDFGAQNILYPTMATAIDISGDMILIILRILQALHHHAARQSNEKSRGPLVVSAFEKLLHYLAKSLYPIFNTVFPFDPPAATFCSASPTSESANTLSTEGLICRAANSSETRCSPEPSSWTKMKW